MFDFAQNRTLSAHRMRSWLTFVLLAACSAPDGDPPAEKPTPAAPQATVDPVDPAAGFVLSKEQLELRPFAVRLSLVAGLVGVQTDHPMFAEARANHIELGDYDFANGVQPSHVWTAQKLALWTQSMKPVCRSTEFRSRFSGLPHYLNNFIPAAYGRPADAADQALLDEALACLVLTEDERYEAVCLALLSSTELVLR